MLRSCLYTLVSLAFAGCVLQRAEESDDAEVLAADDALYLATPPIDLPTPDELPDCWYAQAPDRCRTRCGARSTGGGAPTRLGSRTALAAASLDLPLKAPTCDDPDGIPACPHCSRFSFWPAWASLEVQQDVSSRVVITNANGGYRVMDYPTLQTAGTPSAAGTRSLWLNLAGGGTVLAGFGPDVDFSQNVYMLFSFTGPSGESAAWQWTACPPNGEQCTTVY